MLSLFVLFYSVLATLHAQFYSVYATLHVITYVNELLKRNLLSQDVSVSDKRLNFDNARIGSG